MVDGNRKSALTNVGVVLFAVGLIALVGVFVQFTIGHWLPLWLDVVAGLVLPVGLVVGLVGVARSAQSSQTEPN
ncbi:MAG: hypothetical protein J2O49_03570 [Sciscionella sp.]|nr:hypothetical protein [Sciscionella sp.]